MAPTENTVGLSRMIVIIFFIFIYMGFWGYFYFFVMEPGVIIDQTVNPAPHALEGIVLLPNEGDHTYCLHAETLSRGEPVRIGFYYRIATPTPPDRFGSTEYTQIGKSFITDNEKIVNETITVPPGAVDPIITVSYDYYVSDNPVHLVVKRCES